MAKKKSNKTEFGQFLVSLIKEAGLSQEAFCKEADISRPYFYDILKGSPPSSETQEALYAVLESKLSSNDDRYYKYLNLAAKDRNDIPSDIYDMVLNHPEQWNSVRSALKKMLLVQE